MPGEMPLIKRTIFRLKSGTEHLNYGREIVSDWVVGYCSALEGKPHLLDLGVGTAADLLNIRGKLARDMALFGVDSYKPNIARASELDITAALLDIENDALPFADEYFDVVIANQILEHTKEIFFIFSEVSRVLKKGGIFVIGVPNLASLHNRIALLFGLQPPCIEILGPHVRGFTRASMCTFAECDGFFVVENFAGSNFYPFPPLVSGFLARSLPNLAVGSFYLLKRTEKPGCFSEVLEQRFFETPYATYPRGLSR
jgi:SAM-dependent methyltransferase